MEKQKKPHERPASTADFVRLLGQRLKDARMKKGMSQADVGDRLGLTSTAVSNYESGLSEMPVGRVNELASVLGVSVGWLVQTELDNPLQRDVSKEFLFPGGWVIVITQPYGWTTVYVRIHPTDTKSLQRIFDALKSTHEVMRLDQSQLESMLTDHENPNASG